VVAGNNIYALGESTVMTVPVSGGQPVTLASGQFFTYGIAMDSTNIYWTHLPRRGPDQEDAARWRSANYARPVGNGVFAQRHCGRHH